MFTTTSLVSDGMYWMEDLSGHGTPRSPNSFFQSFVSSGPATPAPKLPKPPKPPLVGWMEGKRSSMLGRTLYILCIRVSSALFLGIIRTILPRTRYLSPAISMIMSMASLNLTKRALIVISGVPPVPPVVAGGGMPQGSAAGAATGSASSPRFKMKLMPRSSGGTSGSSFSRDASPRKPTMSVIFASRKSRSGMTIFCIFSRISCSWVVGGGGVTPSPPLLPPSLKLWAYVPGVQALVTSLTIDSRVVIRSLFAYLCSAMLILRSRSTASLCHG